MNAATDKKIAQDTQDVIKQFGPNITKLDTYKDAMNKYRSVTNKINKRVDIGLKGIAAADTAIDA